MPHKQTHKLLVAGGRGGVGASIVASLAALVAAESGRTLLVDAGSGAGALPRLFGVRPIVGLSALAQPNRHPADLVTAVGDRLDLIATGLDGLAQTLSPEARADALRRLSVLYEKYDTVVIDAGSRLDGVAAVVDSCAPAVLAVTATDRFALAATYALAKSVWKRRAGTTVSVVANRCAETRADEMCGFLTGACSQFLDRAISIAGALPDDPCLDVALAAGMTVSDALDGSPTAGAMRTVLAQILPSRLELRPVATRGGAMALPLSQSRPWS